MTTENNTVDSVDFNSHDTESKQNNNESLEKQLETCLTEQSEWKERAMRLNADLENYKKRMFKDQTLAIHRAQIQIFTQLLPVLDNFERAMVHLKDNQGISMIYAALQDVLKNNGVSEVSYEQFDPHIHEALLEVE